MDVDDDGPERRAADLVAGQGLIGMRERVAAYGGRLSAGAGVDGGFHVEAHIPAPALAAEIDGSVR